MGSKIKSKNLYKPDLKDSQQLKQSAILAWKPKEKQPETIPENTEGWRFTTTTVLQRYVKARLRKTSNNPKSTLKRKPTKIELCARNSELYAERY